MQSVHVQIVPKEGEPKSLVRVLLPITRQMTLSEVKSRWGRLSYELEREIRRARREPPEIVVPEALDDGALALQFTVEDAIIEDRHIDLHRYLEPFVRQSVEYMMAQQPQVWRPR